MYLLQRKTGESLGDALNNSFKTEKHWVKKESDEKSVVLGQVSHLMTNLLLFKLGTVYFG